MKHADSQKYESKKLIGIKLQLFDYPLRKNNRNKRSTRKYSVRNNKRIKKQEKKEKSQGKKERKKERSTISKA